MSAFTFPPPPPPPPQAAPTPPPSYNSPGNLSSRGGRSRGRGSGRGGSHHGGYGHSFNPAVPGRTGGHRPSTNYPLPTYPNWQQTHNSTHSEYQITQPHTAVPLPMPVFRIPNSPQIQHVAPPTHSSRPLVYGNGLLATSTPQDSSHAPLMGPPIRLGFSERHHVTDGQGRNLATLSPIRSAGNKRKREPSYQAQHSSGNSSSIVDQQSRARVNVAPPVPSFGFSLPPKPPPPVSASSVSEKSKKKKRRKNNQLGLTPRGDVHEDSDGDLDEEAAFVQSGQPVQISYHGQTVLLNNQADIQAWVAERKRRFPTQAKVEEKNNLIESEKRKRKEQWKQKKASARDERKTKKGKRSPAPINDQFSDAVDGATSVNIKRDSDKSPVASTSFPDQTPLDDPQQRIAYLEEQLKLAKEAAARKRMPAENLKLNTPKDALTSNGTLMADADHTSNGIQSPGVAKSEPGAEFVLAAHDVATNDGVDNAGHNEQLKHELSMSNNSLDSSAEDMDEVSSDPSSSEICSEDSSISSQTDSDVGPEEESSKTHGPAQQSTQRLNGSHIEQRPICKRFAKSGNCKFKSKCRFSHSRPGEVKTQPKLSETLVAKPPRKRLYNEMVKRELEKEVILSIQVVRYLGSTSFLD